MLGAMIAQRPGPDDPRRDRQGRVEHVLGLAGSVVVEDALAGRPGELLAHGRVHASSVEHVFACV
jgi:hypothetical protein